MLANVKTYCNIQRFDLIKKINTCKSKLQQLFGEKKGEMLYNFPRGIDTRELKLDDVRKSVGVDINWGVRFNQLEQVCIFLLLTILQKGSRIYR